MNIGNLGFTEILILLVIVLLLFGAKRLPEIGSSMGRGIREFKRSLTDVDKSLNEGDRPERLPTRDHDREPIARHDDEDRPEPKRLIS